ncbi:MAG TPA: hypothetical protein DEF45_15685 [Rhodopirellula sp.]|nr:MAG: hypothetical protein CBD74_07115 [Saprospirales bacterium TMED214]HBV64452.1 hypothetical protein [Rhodopirellula sp.]
MTTESVESKQAQTETGSETNLTVDDSFPYHPLACDIDQTGPWGFIDRSSRGITEWLNPILIKEARQSLKSRQFIITFFLLLVASCCWTVLGVVINTPNVYYLPTGSSMIVGYYFVLAIPVMGMVPLAAHRSLAAEIDDSTFEMLSITNLTSFRIVMGKLNSSVLQMLIYFAAVVPCLAFTFLLRGVDLLTIVYLVVLVTTVSLLVTTLALMLATVAASRAGQTMSLLMTMAVILLAEFTCGVIAVESMLYSNNTLTLEVWVVLGTCILISVSCMALFVKAAAARIAPVTENRSTGLRYLMFLQQVLWVGCIGMLALIDRNSEIIVLGIIVLGGYWLLMGTLMLAESPELSPRVQRGLPQTFLGRAFLTWFNPGPGTGFVYAVASGIAGVSVLGIFSFAADLAVTRAEIPIYTTLIVIGYLAGFLGIIRLIAMPLCHRFGRMFSITIGTLVTVMILALMAPSIITVLMTGTVSYTYSTIHTLNWGWTLAEVADRQKYQIFDASFIMCVGLIIGAFNLALLFREFDYRRIAVPERVQQDRQGE